MTYSLSHLWSDKRRKLSRSTSYHQQDHKTRGHFSKHHQRLCIGIVVLSLLVTVSLLFLPKDHDQFLQSLCQKYRSLCSEEADQPLVEPRRSEHLGLGYPTSRIKYDYHIPNTTWASLPVHGVLYMTVKNEDLQKVRETMQSLQDRFNHRLHYPWILLCHEGFTEDFIKYTSSLVSGPVYYGKIDPDALIYPSWIDFDKVKSNLADKIDVELSTYQMMRYQSGLFYHHSLFNNVKYIWRIEPGLTFSCNGGDPFEKMTRHNKTYGFAATRRYQDQKSTEKIWETTKLYMDRSMPPKNTIMQAVIDQHGYTSCHFWSLFEMMDMDFLMSHAYQAFFEYMDRQGAFFYDKLTDSVFRTMAVAMYLDTNQIEFFNEIGFKKEGFISHCPLNTEHMRQCACDIQGNDSSCSIQFSKYINPSSIVETAKFIMLKSDNKLP